MSTPSAMETSFASKLPYDPATDGELVVRFAPEPSGYLHIGHVKACLLNAFFARHFGGRLILRFDDTNPSKETAEFKNSICEDLDLLQVKYDGPTYTSDSIPQLAEAMRQLMKDGFAYCDATPIEEMRAKRMDGIDSADRNKSVEQNLADFEEILNGSELGRTMCVRGKIDMQNANKALRDPVFWRCNVDVPHPRHGTRFKSYPTYDFACPLVDSWSGVTHALRANEYADRIPLYEWVQERFNVRRVKVFEFSRLNLTNTVLSKRKLNWLVTTGVVEGWDDPRFPTVRGMIRRGLNPAALMQFVIELGPSKNTNLMTWDKLWSTNLKTYDAGSKRMMAVSSTNVAVLTLTDVEEPIVKEKSLHPKNAELGTIPMYVTKQILLDFDDAKTIEEGEEITLMRIGNVVVDKVEKSGDTFALTGHTHFDGDVKATKKKLHWVPEREANTRFTLREFDHIISKRQPEEGDEMSDIVNRESVEDTACVGDEQIDSVAVGDVIQLERRGYARCDHRDGDGRLVFHLIPSGKCKTMSAVSTKVDAQKLAKGSAESETATKGLSKKALKRAAWKAAQDAKD